MILLLSLVLACQVILLRAGFGIKNLISPIYVVLYLYLFTAILGYTVYFLFPDLASSEDISAPILLEPEQGLFTLQYFLYFINTSLLGSLVFLIFSGNNKSRKKNASSSPSEISVNRSSELLKTIPKDPNILLKSLTTKLKPGILLFLCSIPTILVIIGVGPEKILLKDRYLDSTIIFFASIGGIGILPAGFLLGYIYADKISLFKRCVCLILILINFIVFFSMATRFLALLPMLLTAGYWFNSKRKKLFGRFLAALSGSLFSPLFYLSLFLRGQSKHGFIPYIQYVGEMSPDLIFRSPLDFIISNLLFAFPLTGKVIEQRLLKDYPIDYLLISINPLPGGLVGWYSINNKLGVNKSIPFNTIGEMYLYGDLICFLLFFALGIIFIFITIVFQKNMEMGRVVYALLLLILVFYFSFLSLQYNLRSSTRILYLAFGLSLFFNKKPKVLKE